MWDKIVNHRTLIPSVYKCLIHVNGYLCILWNRLNFQINLECSVTVFLSSWEIKAYGSLSSIGIFFFHLSKSILRWQTDQFLWKWPHHPLWWNCWWTVSLNKIQKPTHSTHVYFLLLFQISSQKPLLLKNDLYMFIIVSITIDWEEIV